MFTGIIEETGTITGVHKGASSSALSIQGSKIMEDVKIGDSIAVNGVCLTVCSFKQNVFHADVMNETLKRTSLGRLKSGSLVNLERAMPADGRFGGHIVSGHIDGTGILTDKKQDDIAVILTIHTTASIVGYLIEKGSVALDGISLTVCGVNDKEQTFQVSIIPHTASHTTLLLKNPGDMINIENDIIGKYIKKFLTTEERVQKKSNITKDFLLKSGF